MKKYPMWLKIFVGMVILFLLIQLVPYGRDHSNPAVVKEPQWDSADTRLFAQRACFDCHSNEVVWPWYSHVAPVSWLIQRDVDEGRWNMNFSNWDQGYRDFEELKEVIQEGEMPPFQYLMMHPNAKFTDAEKEQFIQGLQNTLGSTQ